ncbi:MAG: hypothetical protein ACTSRP_01110 [Candidatus Helarchaeota archaeon]
MKSLKDTRKKLEKEKKELIELYKKLEEDFKKGRIELEYYNNKKREIERQLVEIMDRLTQINFLSG